MKLAGGKLLFWGAVVALAAGFVVLFNDVLAPFVLGMAIAYLLNPLVNGLVKRFKWPRWGAVIAILGGFLLIVGAALAFLVPLLLREGSQLAGYLPQWIDRAQAALAALAHRVGIDPAAFTGGGGAAGLVDNLQGQAGSLLKAGGNIIGGLLKGGAAVFGFISFVLLMPIVAFYMMLDWPHLVDQFKALVPRGRAATVNRLLAQIDATLSGFVRGQLSVCAILALFYGVGLSAVGVRFGFVIGISAGILTIMPYVGSALGLLMAVGVAWATGGDSVQVVAALAVFGVGQFIEGNFLTPRLVGDNVGLHPLWIIFALLAGGRLLGFTGMLIAVPVAAAAGVMVRFAISEYKKSAYYTHG